MTRLYQVKLVNLTLVKDLTGLYRNLHNPIFAFVCFQTNRLNDQKHDPSVFDNCNVRYIQIEINGKKYPNEDLDLDFKDEDYSEAYQMLLT